jgi:hypothetical protein
MTVPEGPITYLPAARTVPLPIPCISELFKHGILAMFSGEKSSIFVIYSYTTTPESQ